MKPSMHEDELPEDMPRADYDKWYVLSYVPDGVGCRVGPRYPFEPEQPSTKEAQKEVAETLIRDSLSSAEWVGNDLMVSFEKSTLIRAIVAALQAESMKGK